jgi:hypothetical protein
MSGASIPDLRSLQTISPSSDLNLDPSKAAVSISPPPEKSPSK